MMEYPKMYLEIKRDENDDSFREIGRKIFNTRQQRKLNKHHSRLLNW